MRILSDFFVCFSCIIHRQLLDGVWHIIAPFVSIFLYPEIIFRLRTRCFAKVRHWIWRNFDFWSTSHWRRLESLWFWSLFLKRRHRRWWWRRSRRTVTVGLTNCWLFAYIWWRWRGWSWRTCGKHLEWHSHSRSPQSCRWRHCLLTTTTIYIILR